MADSARVAITRLNSSNYQVWRYRLELLLMKEDLWDIVTQETPETPNAAWLKRDGKAKATIGLLIEDNQLVHIRKETTAKGSWDALQKYHQKSTLTSKVFLLKRICRIKLEEDGNMEDHVNLLVDLVDQLTALGEVLAEHLVVALLLCSLPETYDTLITALESRPEEDLTLELVKGKLIHEFKRRQETQLSVHRDADSVLKVQNNYAAKKKTKGACFYCNKPGHFKKDCHKFKADKSRISPTHKVKKVIDTPRQGDLDETEGDHTCLKASQSSIEGQWYVDSGATCHMSSDFNFYSKLDRSVKSKVHLADGKLLDSEGIGEGTLRCVYDGNNSHIIKLKEVMYIPELQGSLLSVRKLTKLGCIVEFKGSKCIITKDGSAVATASTEGHLYRLDCAEEALKATHSKPECMHIWHRRMGHRDPDAIKALADQGLAEGIDLVDCKLKKICDSCIRGKMSRSPFPKASDTRSKGVLDLVHSDVCGPMQTQTPGGKRYILTLIDDYSRYTEIYLLNKKSETLDRVREYVQAVQTKFQKKVKTFRSDRGGEYTGSHFKDFLKQEGIEDQTTAPYSPQQNGIAERKNRTLMEMTRCMLIDAKMDDCYWGEAANTANYLQNRLPTRSTDVTPYERWNGSPPDISHVRVFGSATYAMIPKEKRRKLDEKAELFTLVGYARGSKAYRLLDLKTNKIHISRDVRFVEGDHTLIGEDCNGSCADCKKQPEPDKPEKDEAPDIKAPDAGINYEDDSNQSDFEDFRDEIPERLDPVVRPVLRRSQRQNKGKPPERLIEVANMAKTSATEEPRTRNDALAGQDKAKWHAAMEEEIQSLQENGTWELTDLPPNRIAIGSKWTYKLKHNAEGNVCRFKARLVAQGFSQKYGDDYDEVFAPVMKQTTLRTLLAVAGKEGMSVRHFDIKTAFLNGDLEEDIFMKQPEGYEVEDGKVCKLKKSLYGLKQSARAWNLKINEVLTNDGFRRGKADPCLYSKSVNGHWIYVLIYVDDLVIASTDDLLINTTAHTLGERFDISDLGDLKFFLGIQIDRDADGIFYMHQGTYIDKILTRFNMQDARPSKIPMDPGYNKRNEVHEEMHDKDRYRRAIGALLYITVNTRPDIAVSTSILSRKVTCPTEADWTEVKRTFRYLKGSKLTRVKLGSTEDCETPRLIGYVDADWAGDNTDRKSNSGYLFKLYGGTISWASRKQACVALSSTEAEYISLSEGCQEATWIRRLLDDLNVKADQTIIYEDNQSCLKLLESEKVNKRTKHIDTRYHYAKDLQATGKIKFMYCPTFEMTADLLTKPLEAVKTRKLAKLAGLCENISTNSIEKGC